MDFNTTYNEHSSGEFKSLERGVKPLAREAPPPNFWVATPTSGHVNAFMTHILSDLNIQVRQGDLSSAGD